METFKEFFVEATRNKRGSKMASGSYDQLVKLYATHIVEVKVIRRNEKPGRGPTRRFLCTNSPLILDSIAGKSAFHFKPPMHPPPYDARSKNLLTVFDLLMQKYRNVNLDTDVIKAARPVRNKQEVEEFWQYFAQVLSKWSSSNKQMFMNM